MNRKAGNYYETDDYTAFRYLVGNREIKPERVKAVIESIESIGYVLSPVLVNEKMEIIDGQARVTALQKLGLPVHYTVQPGIGVKECIAMNVKQTNWVLTDFIHCYANLGYASYKYLEILFERYGKKFTVSPILYALRGSVPNNKIIKEGRFTCTEKDYERACKTLEYLSKFTPIFEGEVGFKSYYLIAIAYCYNSPSIDNNKLLSVICTRKIDLDPVVNVAQAVEVIEKIYNLRSRNKVYILTEYKMDYDKKKQEYRSTYYKKGKGGDEEKA